MIRVVDEYDDVWDSDAIMGLSQSISGAGQNFTLGNTYCRSFELKVAKSAVTHFPEEMLFLFEDNDVPGSTLDDWEMWAVMYLDSVDDSDDVYYTFHLSDLMARLNVPLEYEAGMTVYAIINSIARKYEIMVNMPLKQFPFVPGRVTTYYLQYLALNYVDNLTERDFLSYIAEVNGCYVYIGHDGNINVREHKYHDSVLPEVNADRCSDFRIGDHHLFDRVYVELGSGTIYYPETSSNDTLYLNPDNIFFADYEEQGYTREAIVQQVYEYINGFEFYDISIEKCDIVADLGAKVNFVYGEDEYLFLALHNPWEYNARWLGGYECNFTNQLQQETQIVTTTEQLKRLNIRIDREKGIIEQEIADLESDTQTRFTQTDDSISAVAARVGDLETTLEITPDGVFIRQGTEGAYVQFTDSGMNIFVNDQLKAWANADGFSAEELMVSDGDSNNEQWHIHMSNGGATLTFLRR